MEFVVPGFDNLLFPALDASLEVREFIERLTENLVGGSVDDVTVEPLSSQTECKFLRNPLVQIYFTPTRSLGRL